jgi:hypothetical protein
VVLGRRAAEPLPADACPAIRFNYPDRGSFRVGPERPFYEVNFIQLQAGRFKPFAQSDPTRDACSTPPPHYDDYYCRRSRTEKTFADSDVSVRRSWLVVTRETRFLEYDLGCSGIVCDLRPLAQPVLP